MQQKEDDAQMEVQKRRKYVRNVERSMISIALCARIVVISSQLLHVIIYIIIAGVIVFIFGIN